jgi:hypothetical protein
MEENNIAQPEVKIPPVAEAQNTQPLTPSKKLKLKFILPLVVIILLVLLGASFIFVSSSNKNQNSNTINSLTPTPEAQVPTTSTECPLSLEANTNTVTASNSGANGEEMKTVNVNVQEKSGMAGPIAEFANGNSVTETSDQNNLLYNSKAVFSSTDGSLSAPIISNDGNHYAFITCQDKGCPGKNNLYVDGKLIGSSNDTNLIGISYLSDDAKHIGYVVKTNTTSKDTLGVVHNEEVLCNNHEKLFSSAHGFPEGVNNITTITGNNFLANANTNDGKIDTYYNGNKLFTTDVGSVYDFKLTNNGKYFEYIYAKSPSNLNTLIYNSNINSGIDLNKANIQAFNISENGQYILVDKQNIVHYNNQQFPLPIPSNMLNAKPIITSIYLNEDGTKYAISYQIGDNQADYLALNGKVVDLHTQNSDYYKFRYLFQFGTGENKDTLFAYKLNLPQ